MKGVMALVAMALDESKGAMASAVMVPDASTVAMASDATGVSKAAMALDASKGVDWDDSPTDAD